MVCGARYAAIRALMTLRLYWQRDIGRSRDFDPDSFLIHDFAFFAISSSINSHQNPPPGTARADKISRERS